MDDWKGFLKFFVGIMGVTALVALSKNETLMILFGVVVVVGAILVAIFGGGGGRDGANF
jgi:hypothetical protein